MHFFLWLCSISAAMHISCNHTTTSGHLRWFLSFSPCTNTGRLNLKSLGRHFHFSLFFFLKADLQLLAVTKCVHPSEEENPVRQVFSLRLLLSSQIRSRSWKPDGQLATYAKYLETEEFIFFQGGARSAPVRTSEHIFRLCNVRLSQKPDQSVRSA